MKINFFALLRVVFAASLGIINVSNIFMDWLASPARLFVKDKLESFINILGAWAGRFST